MVHTRGGREGQQKRVRSNPPSLSTKSKYTITSVVKGIGRVYIERQLFFLSIDCTRKGEEDHMNHLVGVGSKETRLTNYPIGQSLCAVGVKNANSQAGANADLRDHHLLSRPRTCNSEKKQKKSSACPACPACPARPASGRAAQPSPDPLILSFSLGRRETTDRLGGVRDCILNFQTARLSPVSQPWVPSLISKIRREGGPGRVSTCRSGCDGAEGGLATRQTLSSSKGQRPEGLPDNHMKLSFGKKTKKSSKPPESPDSLVWQI